MQEPNESPRENGSKFVLDLIASGFYSGHCPHISGTCGTLAAALLAYLTMLFYPTCLNFTTLLPFTMALFFLGVWVSNKALALQIYDARQDPKQIVIDEFVGYYVSILTVTPSPLALLIAFLWFRAFDIIKPPPVKQFERLPGGWGIMADDVVAGIMALATTKACLYYLPLI
jgi:phosphatidylglycerophosphatase A